MESRLTLHGQPVQPILVLFPLGLFLIGLAFDLGALVSGLGLLGVAAYWTIAAGLIGGVLVAVAGVVDLLTIRRGTRSKRFAAAHTLITVGVLAAFGASWWLRAPAADHGVNGALFGLEALAVLACGFGAWLRTEPAGRFGAWADGRASLSELVRASGAAGPETASPAPARPRSAAAARLAGDATTILAGPTSRTVRLPAGLLAAARRPAPR